MRNRQAPRAKHSSGDASGQSSIPHTKETAATDLDRPDWEIGAIRAAIRINADIALKRVEDAVLALRGFLLVAGGHEDCDDLRLAYISVGDGMDRLRAIAEA